MVISWILGNVNETIKKSIMFMSTAKDMWKNLEQRFHVNNGARRYQICKILYEIKQHGKTVLWEELYDLTNYPPISEMNAEVSEYVRFRQQ
ncbi:Interferon-induced very large GTPase 1 [Bienertia sinuspersici]